MKIFSIGKKALVGIGGAAVVTPLLAWGVLNGSDEMEVLDMSLADPDFTFSEVFSSLKPQQEIWVDGVDIIHKTRGQQTEFILSRLALMGERQLRVISGDEEILVSLSDLGISFQDGVESILDRFDYLKNEEAVSRLPNIHQLAYGFNEVDLDNWMAGLSEHLNVPAQEHGLTKNSNGTFSVVPGTDGIQVDRDELARRTVSVLGNLHREDLVIEVVTESVGPQREKSFLETVDTRIARAVTHFDTGISRAANVRRGAELINGQTILPGEEFSFNQLVVPINWDNGWRYGTVFRNGRMSEAVGGGVCQVSSTLYWAMMRAGLTNNTRRPHSLPVFYLPRGFDATMWTLYPEIDLRFVNTWDYPLYLNAYTQGGQLVVEFWSNSEALGGYTFEPVSHRVGTGTTVRNGETRATKSYDTWLQRRRDGQLIESYFLHRDTYLSD